MFKKALRKPSFITIYIVGLAFFTNFIFEFVLKSSGICHMTTYTLAASAIGQEYTNKHFELISSKIRKRVAIYILIFFFSIGFIFKSYEELKVYMLLAIIQAILIYFALGWGSNTAYKRKDSPPQTLEGLFKDKKSRTIFILVIGIPVLFVLGLIASSYILTWITALSLK